MVVNMYIIGPKKDRFKLVFFGLFNFSKMKRPRPRLQKTNKQSFSVLVLFGLSPVWLQSFASPRTGLSNTNLHAEFFATTGTADSLGLPTSSFGSGHGYWGVTIDNLVGKNLEGKPYKKFVDLKWW